MNSKEHDIFTYLTSWAYSIFLDSIKVDEKLKEELTRVLLGDINITSESFSFKGPVYKAVESLKWAGIVFNKDRLSDSLIEHVLRSSVKNSSVLKANALFNDRFFTDVVYKMSIDDLFVCEEEIFRMWSQYLGSKDFDYDQKESLKDITDSKVWLYKLVEGSISNFKEKSGFTIGDIISDNVKKSMPNYFLSENTLLKFLSEVGRQEKGYQQTANIDNDFLRFERLTNTYNQLLGLKKSHPGLEGIEKTLEALGYTLLLSEGFEGLEGKKIGELKREGVYLRNFFESASALRSVRLEAMQLIEGAEKELNTYLTDNVLNWELIEPVSMNEFMKYLSEDILNWRDADLFSAGRLFTKGLGEEVSIRDIKSRIAEAFSLVDDVDADFKTGAFEKLISAMNLLSELKPWGESVGWNEKNKVFSVLKYMLQAESKLEDLIGEHGLDAVLFKSNYSFWSTLDTLDSLKKSYSFKSNLTHFMSLENELRKKVKEPGSYNLLEKAVFILNSERKNDPLAKVLAGRKDYEAKERDLLEYKDVIESKLFSLVDDMLIEVEKNYLLFKDELADKIIRLKNNFSNAGVLSFKRDDIVDDKEILECLDEAYWDISKEFLKNAGQGYSAPRKDVSLSEFISGIPVVNFVYDTARILVNPGKALDVIFPSALQLFLDRYKNFFVQLAEGNYKDNILLSIVEQYRNSFFDDIGALIYSRKSVVSEKLLAKGHWKFSELNDFDNGVLVKLLCEGSLKQTSKQDFIIDSYALNEHVHEIYVESEIFERLHGFDSLFNLDGDDVYYFENFPNTPEHLKKYFLDEYTYNEKLINFLHENRSRMNSLPTGSEQDVLAIVKEVFGDFTAMVYNFSEDYSARKGWRRGDISEDYSARKGRSGEGVYNFLREVGGYILFKGVENFLK